MTRFRERSVAKRAESYVSPAVPSREKTGSGRDNSSADLDSIGDSASAQILVRVLAKCHHIPTSSHRAEADHPVTRTRVDPGKPVPASVPAKASPSPEASRSAKAIALKEACEELGVKCDWIRIALEDETEYLEINMREVTAKRGVDLGRDWWRDGCRYASEA